ncbi:hypothetical protein [Levilactobacillus cerevisiae]|uniref:hypothetical protein n=2 Tax=Levilactobacillus cerevisiae TaxID=1704076 RepID=UPI0013DE03AA
MEMLLIFFKMIIQNKSLIQTDERISVINIGLPVTELPQLSAILTMLGTCQAVFSLTTDNDTILLSVKASENLNIDSKVKQGLE